MEIATSLSRICRLALIGVGVAFAWILLTIALGFGTANAHADDSEGDSGLLGAVTSLLDTTTTTLTGTVSAVGGGVSSVVTSVVGVAPAPVQQPVTQAVNTVGSVVTAVTEPVAETLGGGVVTSVVEPVVTEVVQPTTKAVSGIPLVGTLVSSLALDRALLDVGTTLDTTLGATLDTVVTITDPVVALPAAPGAPGESAAVAVARGTGAVVGASTVATHSSPRTGSPFSAAGTAVVRADASAQASLPSSFTAGLCPWSTTSSGPAGAGSGAWALVAMIPLAAHRAWVRRAGPSDDLVPPAPSASTDVSPD